MLYLTSDFLAMRKLGMAHYNAAMRILRYLRGSIDIRLTYRASGGTTPSMFRTSDATKTGKACGKDDTLMAMCDADYAGCPTTRRLLQEEAIQVLV